MNENFKIRVSETRRTKLWTSSATTSACRNSTWRTRPSFLGSIQRPPPPSTMSTGISTLTGRRTRTSTIPPCSTWCQCYKTFFLPSLMTRQNKLAINCPWWKNQFGLSMFIFSIKVYCTSLADKYWHLSTICSIFQSSLFLMRLKMMKESDFYKTRVCMTLIHISLLPTANVAKRLL